MFVRFGALRPRQANEHGGNLMPRLAANSVCTTGSATTTDHMPTLPSEPIATATASRAHARRESGTKAAGSLEGFEGACTGGNFVGRGPRVKRRDEMLGMQMRRGRFFTSPRSARGEVD